MSATFAEAVFNIEVIVVGAGVAGASAALYLARAGIKNVYVLECGQVGRGAPTGRPLVEHALIRDGDVDVEDTETTAFPFARKSGTAVFDDPVSAMKMMLVIFPCSSSEFVSHHGIEGAKRYLRLAQKGIDLEKKLGTELLSEAGGLKSLGSLYVCERDQIEEFLEEFETLKSLIVGTNIRIEWWDDEEKVKRVSGSDKFVRAISFPDDAVIDSSAYSRALLRAAVETGCVTLVESCPSVTGVDTVNGHAIVKLSDGSNLKAKHCVLATGGLFMEKNLAGILTPCWSYLVSLKDPEGAAAAAAAAAAAPPVAPAEEGESSSTDSAIPPGAAAPKGDGGRLAYPDSPNFFTWGFTHDWCLTKGHLRCSGEDHFSALKAPRALERCQSLAKWALNTYQYLIQDGWAFRYGVYSETPDRCAIVGTANPDSRVCYLLGCNASGQAPLSFAASLIPGLLGYRRLSEEQQDLFKVLNIRRFALLPSVMNKQFE